jgi:hypothetical protein
MHVAATALHDRTPSGRPAAVAADNRQLRRMTCGGRRAVDITRQRRGACAQPAADRVQLPAAPHGASMRPCLAPSVAWMVRCVAREHHVDRDRIGLTMRIAPSSERTLQQRQYQQSEEHGRIFEWPTASVADVYEARRWPLPCEVQVPLGANRTADARSESLLRMAYPSSSRSPSVVAISTNCGRLCHALRRICFVHYCHLLPILVTLP